MATRDAASSGNGTRRVPLSRPASSALYVEGLTDRFRDSSAVEQPAVNRRVEGSNPSRGACSKPHRPKQFSLPPGCRERGRKAETAVMYRRRFSPCPVLSKFPSYRLHKSSGQAVVTVRLSGGDRRDIYLGDYNSPESHREYGRIIAELADSAAMSIVAGRSSRPDPIGCASAATIATNCSAVSWSGVTPSACRGVGNPSSMRFKPMRSWKPRTLHNRSSPATSATLFEDASETSLRWDNTYDEYRFALRRHQCVLVYRRGMIEEVHCMAHSWYGLSYSVLPVCPIRTFRFIECPWLQINRKRTAFVDGQGLWVSSMTFNRPKCEPSGGRGRVVRPAHSVQILSRYSGNARR